MTVNTAATQTVVVSAFGAGSAANTIDYSDPNSVINAFVRMVSCLGIINARNYC